MRGMIFCQFNPLIAIFSLLLLSSTAIAGDDKAISKAVSDMLGITKDEGIEKIDYSERPKLVMPKTSSQLPPPREKPTLPEGWPQDASVGTRRTDRFARAPNAPPEKPGPKLMERLRGPASNTAAGADDEPGLLQKIIINKQKSAEAEPDDPVRQLLSDPPEGLRSPTKPLKNVKDTTHKGGFLGKIFGGEDNDSDPVAQTAGVNEQMKKPSSSNNSISGAGVSSSLSDYLPSFLKK